MGAHRTEAVDGTIKLPLLAKTGKLAAIPGQPEGVTYAVVWDACGEPARGLGYVAELLPSRRARPIAWLAGDGKAYSCDGPLRDLAGLRPSLTLARWEEQPDTGAIRVPNPDGSSGVTLVGEFRRGWDGKYAFVNPTRDPGRFFASRTWELRYFLAVCWLTFVHVPQTQGVAPGTGGGRISETLLALVGKPLPDALDAMIWRGTANDGSVSEFERFAARQLVEAGAADVRAIAAEHNVHLVRLSTTSLFWMRFDDDVDERGRATLLAVEAALNRLWYVAWAAEAADGGVGMLHAFDQRFCAQAAQGALREASRIAGRIAAAEGADNPHRTVGGASGQRGGAWDVMTRFAAICERTRFPFRLEYRFDVDVASGAMAVRFAVPTPAMFPATRLEAPGWQDARARRPAHAAAYAVRLAGLLAQAAFASSVRITAVDLTAHEGALDGRPVLSLGFERTPFVMGAQPALRDGRCDDPALDDDPLALLHILRPARHAVAFAADRGLTTIEPLPLNPAFAANRVPLWRDGRPLPEALRPLLRADTAAELDVMHDDAAVGSDDVRAIVEDNEDSPLVGSVQLEAALAQLGEIGLDGQGRLPLYCGQPAMRLLVSLNPAESPDAAIPGIEQTPASERRYWKIPDAVYDAHLWLGRFAHRSGEHERAVAEAVQCLTLAPTTPRSYVELAVRHAEQDQYAQAADVLVRGLRVATLEQDYVYMYYRLAYALWQTGRHNQSVACYTLVTDCANEALADTAREELGELRRQTDDARPPMARAEAEQVLRAAGIPVAPTEAATETLARAAIGLIDAGFPLAAADAVWLVGRHTGGSDVLGALPPSLRLGVADAPRPD